MTSILDLKRHRQTNRSKNSKKKSLVLTRATKISKKFFNRNNLKLLIIDISKHVNIVSINTTIIQKFKILLEFDMEEEHRKIINIDYENYLKNSKVYISKYDELLNNLDQLSNTLNYLNVAKKYHPITIVYNSQEKRHCKLCNNLYEKDICETCKIDIESADFIIDYDEFNSTKKSDNDSFYTALLSYQGRQNLDKKTIIVAMRIKEHLAKSGITDIKYEDRHLVYKCLEDLNLNSYHSDVLKICNYCWNTPLPNIDHLVPIIMRDYNKTEFLYHTQTKSDNRKSSLNSQWRLMKILTRLGIDCKIDFKPLKTADIIEYYSRVWKNFCEEFDWEYTDD